MAGQADPRPHRDAGTAQADVGYLQGDGGDLYVMGLAGNTLSVHYQGACGSCPSSTAGTLMAIQNLLQAEVDDAMVVTMA